jgi:hypothetical protein
MLQSATAKSQSKQNSIGTSSSKRDCAPSSTYRIRDLVRRSVFAAILATLFAMPTAAQFLEAVPPPEDPKLHGPRAYPPFSLVVLLPIEQSKHSKTALELLRSKPKTYTQIDVSDIVTEPDGTELLMTLTDAPEECSPIGCAVYIRQKVDGAWVYATGVNGFIHSDHATVGILEAPIIGRLLPDKGPSIYGPPVTIFPSYKGRRTCIDAERGQAWDGRDWVYFCFQHCAEG